VFSVDRKVFLLTNFSNGKQTQEILESGFPETTFRETNMASINFIGLMVICLKKKLCVPNCSIHELLIRGAHKDGLIENFWFANTLEILHENFYWPKMCK